MLVVVVGDDGDVAIFSRPVIRAVLSYVQNPDTQNIVLALMAP